MVEMGSSIYRRISHYLSEADDYYSRGKYDKCEHTLTLLSEEVDATKSLLEVCGMKKCVFSSVIENNILISKGLAFKWSLHDAYGTWNGLMHSFSKLNRKMRSLHIVQKAPLKCYLNTVYNGLYWGWWHPNSLHSDNIHVETCLHMAVSCFKRVLEVSHDPSPSSSFCNTEDMVLCLMNKVANNLLHVGGEECLQLLEMCGIVIYILTELQAERDILIKCTNIITFILSMRNQLLLSMRVAFENKQKEAVTNFKFGFHEVNSTLEKCDFETVPAILKNLCCICYIKIEEYAKCVECLEVCEVETEKLQDVCSYLKAYAYFHIKDIDAGLLNLLKLEHMVLSTQMKIRGHLLHGSLLAKQGRHFEALQEFFKPLSTDLQNIREKKDFYPATLYHIAEQYEILYSMSEAHSQSDVKTVQDHGKCRSQQTKLLNTYLRADHLDTLLLLVKVLREDEDGDESAVDINSAFNLHVKILNIVHPQPEINMPVALFKLATVLAADGDCSSAGKIFMELLTQRELQPMPSLLTQLPHVSVLYHSAAVLMIKTNQLDQAETLCRQAISYYSSRSFSPRDLEHSLLCLEDDLVALMVLAQVHKLKGDEIKESEILDRCLRLVSNYKKRCEASIEGSTVHICEQTEGDTDLQVLTALQAKLHLRKAHNYQWRGPAFQNDCFIELKQALLCNSGDKDVGSSYKHFMDENHQYSVHDKSQLLNQYVNLNVETCSSLALKYLLQSQASDESDVDMFVDS